MAIEQLKLDTHATSSGKVGKTVEVARDTSTPAVPGDYANYMGSENNQFDTYTKRASKLMEFLGNKDEVKG